MTIRKATASDSDSIAKLFMLAMNTLVYRFIGERDEQKALKFLVQFIQQKKNQYSYQNCHLATINREVVGVINVYDGAFMEILRQPILNIIHQNHPEFNIEDETQAGELYIDVLSVHPRFQRKGIGTQLLKHVIREHETDDLRILGLLVDKNNPAAKKMYLKIGFEKIGEKTLSGHEMEHLQLKI